MTSINPFDKFYQYSIGLDQLFSELNRTKTLQTTNYPPFNIINVDVNNYVIEMAIAGFGKKDINISMQENNLRVEGTKDDKGNANTVHRGISQRAFDKNFVLAQDVVVTRADIENGILTIKLEKVIPEEKQPKTIDIGKDVRVASFLAE
jgi:molecular chaperone IbpA